MDAIIGMGRLAVEIKATDEAKSRHMHGLKAFSEEFPEARLIIVSLDKYRRKMNGVDIIPATEFLHDLWQGHIV